MKALGATLFIVGVLWFLFAYSPFVIGWPRVGFENGMIIGAGIVYGPVGVVVGAFILLKHP